MHFYRFALSGNVERTEGDGHTGFQESSFYSSDGDSSNTTDLVDVLKWESEGLVLGSLGGNEVVKSFNEGRSSVPFHVV